jgi:hypothetical protein
MRGLSNVPWFSTLVGLRQIAFSGSVIATPTASATPHVKGAWAQLIASTSEEFGLLMVRAENVGVAATETSMLLDVGIGAAGSESPIMENLAVGGASVGSGLSGGLTMPLPVRIPSGSRLSCRVQALIPSDTCTVTISAAVMSARQTLPESVDVIGTDTATSRGTAFSGSVGAWTQIAASTSRRYRGVYLVPSVIGTDILSFTRALEIAVGPAGSEAEVGRVYCDFRNTEAVFHASTYFYAPIACDIPAGSRLSVRTPVSANPDRYGVSLIGIP